MEEQPSNKEYIVRCKYQHLMGILEKKHPALYLQVQLKLMTYMVEACDQYVMVKGHGDTVVYGRPRPM